MNSPLIQTEGGTHFGVRVYFSGQFGNQLNHYCVGKILAEKKRLEFVPPPFFTTDKNKPVVWSGPPLFEMIPTRGRMYPERGAFQFGAFNWYDFDSLPDNCALHVCHGWWCRYELYREWKRKIREEWLKIPESRFVGTDASAVYIHVRRGDKALTDFGYQGGLESNSTTLEVFERCLGCLEYDKIVVVTDSPEDPFHDGFRKFGRPVSVVRESWDVDFLTLASCRQLIISNSTFSWWAAFLGKAEQIIIPMATGTNWGKGMGAKGLDREEYPNLYVDDESERWKQVI